MATPSLDTTHYTLKEFQLLVKDAPVVPAEIPPFVGIQFRRSVDIYGAGTSSGNMLKKVSVGPRTPGLL